MKLNPRQVGLAKGVKIPDFPLLIRLNKNPPESDWSGVRHLEETGKGITGEYKDASGQAHATSCRINGSDPS